MPSLFPFSRLTLATVFVLVLLCRPLSATWSIIIVDTRTKEIAVGSCTCLTGFDLKALTPVVLVGVGAATAQSSIDLNAVNRKVIWAELKNGTAPAQILTKLSQIDSAHQTRQYGIADTQGRTATFTGNRANAWAGGVTGKIGTLYYAVQGNILTGTRVVDKAVEAIRNTQGDLAAKLVAGMEAARIEGGDSRCTPNKKSAHIGYLIVARQGDQDGTCTSGRGCATGSYYMCLNVDHADPSQSDPVKQLTLFYEYWRMELIGRPDHHLSTVDVAPTLPADGLTTATATVTLRDWQDKQLADSKPKLTVTLDASSSAKVTIGAVQPKGKGVYTFTVTAGTQTGTANLRIVADDGIRPVLLTPRTAIVLNQDPLWRSTGAISAANGGGSQFVLNAGAKNASRAYLLLTSSSGSSPGIKISNNLTIPVNPDPILLFFLGLANHPPLLVNTFGTFDKSGRATAAFNAAPMLLAPLKGRQLTFAYATIQPIDFASQPVVIDIR